MDDILIASNNEIKLKEVKEKLPKEFEMSVIGEPKEFLGIALKKDKTNKIIEMS